MGPGPAPTWGVRVCHMARSTDRVSRSSTATCLMAKAALGQGIGVGRIEKVGPMASSLTPPRWVRIFPMTRLADAPFPSFGGTGFVTEGASAQSIGVCGVEHIGAMT